MSNVRTTSDALFSHPEQNYPMQDNQMEYDDDEDDAAADDHHLQTFNQNLRPNNHPTYHKLGYSTLQNGTDLCRSERKFDKDPEFDEFNPGFIDVNQEERPEQRNFHGLWTNFQEMNPSFKQNFEACRAELLLLVQNFADVCVIRINDLHDQYEQNLSTDDKKNLAWLENERNTWWLFEALLGLERQRRSDEATEPIETYVPNRYSSLPNPSALRYGEDFLAVRDLKTKTNDKESDQFRKCNAVVKWFEKCSQENNHIRNEETLEKAKQCNAFCLGETLNNAHPDFSHCKDPDHTYPDEHASTHLKNVWYAIRSGRRDIAEELCRENGDIWRAESIQGGDVGRLSAVKGWIGNPQRFMWKKVAFAISQKSTLSDNAVDGGQGLIGKSIYKREKGDACNRVIWKKHL